MKRASLFILKMILLFATVICILGAVYICHAHIDPLYKGLALVVATLFSCILALLAALVDMKMSSMPEGTLNGESQTSTS